VILIVCSAQVWGANGSIGEAGAIYTSGSTTERFDQSCATLNTLITNQATVLQGGVEEP
jgi:hypothetical protein